MRRGEEREQQGREDPRVSHILLSEISGDAPIFSSAGAEVIPARADTIVSNPSAARDAFHGPAVDRGRCPRAPSAVRDVRDPASPGDISAVTQPIVRMADGRTVGFEVLARSRSSRSTPPDQWLAHAEAAGCRTEVELACLRAGLARYPARRRPLVPQRQCGAAARSAHRRSAGIGSRARPGGHRARADRRLPAVDRAVGRARPARARLLRSTTSAPATPTWLTSFGFRRSSSRSIAASSAACIATGIAGH